MATTAAPPHPFPARMAPELALAAFDSERLEGPVLDPMCGSGTVLRSALQAGYNAIGFDVDPLAVLMATVWTSQVDADDLVREARQLADSALRYQRYGANLPWIDEDKETTDFVKYWFAPTQLYDLRLLSRALADYSGPLHDPLALCLSKIIVTKERGASLARDVSHSRPHRVSLDNDYDVMSGFVKAASQMGRRLKEALPAKIYISLGDARRLDTVSTSSVARVVTSPPYLNAIDYLRGHRLALVWLGYSLGELREIRGTSIGSERGITANASSATSFLLDHIDTTSLSSRINGMLRRYAVDLSTSISEIARVLQPSAGATLIIGNSTVRGAYIDNAQIAEKAAKVFGLTLEEKMIRILPASRRYLPPPDTIRDDNLSGRMRSEVILRFRKVA